MGRICELHSPKMVGLVIHLLMLTVNVSCSHPKRTGIGQHSKHLIHISTSSHSKRYCVPLAMNLAMKSGLQTSIAIMMIPPANIILPVAMWWMMMKSFLLKEMRISWGKPVNNKYYE